MNSSEELTGFPAGLSRYEEKITREEELDKLKQEILNRIKLETHDIVKQKTIEVKKEIMPYLKPIETLEKEVLEIKNSMIKRDEMEDEMNKVFDKFVKGFSQAIESIEDPEVKGILKRTVDAFTRG